MGFDEYILLFLAIVSVPFYVSVMIMIFRHRNKPPFNGAFFKLFLNCGFFDLGNVFYDWLLRKPLARNLFGFGETASRNLTGWAIAMFYLDYYIDWGMQTGVVLVAINRVAVIAFNINWTKRKTAVLLCSQFLIPFILMSPFFPERIAGYYNNSTGGFKFGFESTSFWTPYYCFTICLMMGIICAVCYAMTFIKARESRLKMAAKSKGKSEQENEKNKKKLRAELKLAVMGASLAAITAICGTMCLVGYLDGSQWSWMGPILNVLYEVYAWCSPYLLLLLSSQVWSTYKDFISCGRLKKKNKASAVPSVITKVTAIKVVPKPD